MDCSGVRKLLRLTMARCCWLCAIAFAGCAGADAFAGCASAETGGNACRALLDLAENITF